MYELYELNNLNIMAATGATVGHAETRSGRIQAHSKVNTGNHQISNDNFPKPWISMSHVPDPWGPSPERGRCH